MVNIFLPYSSFEESARVLDQKRLGKQRVETMQIMTALVLGGKGWVNHTATRAWRGFEAALMEYQEATCFEWSVNRGFKDTCLEKTRAIYYGVRPLYSEPMIMPPWLGDEDFHRSHQSNLVRKDPEYYGPLFPGVPPDLPYIWPRTEFSLLPGQE